MQVEEIRTILSEAMLLRFPRWDPETHAREKVEKLEDYLGQTAFHRGELESALYWAREAEKLLLEKWDTIVGWEVHRDRKTNEGVDDAKRRIDPETWAGLDEVRRLMYDIGRQIKRLEKDFDAVSRDYTFVTGS